MGIVTNVRIEGWEKRLVAHIASAGPFEWGSQDCALWCATWVKTCTGVDLLAEWAGLYTTGAEANALMKARGFSDAAAIADAHLPVKPITMAQRGDIVQHPNGALGICNGRLSHFIGEQGLTEKTLECQRSWRVG